MTAAATPPSPTDGPAPDAPQPSAPPPVRQRAASATAHPHSVGPQLLSVARAHGWSDHELRGPMWSIPHRGLRMFAGLDRLAPRARIDVAAALLPPGAALGGWAAVHLLGGSRATIDGLDLTGKPLPIDLMLPPGHRMRRPSADFPLAPHEVRLHAADIVVVDGIPVTSVTRTGFDVARGANLVESVVLLDALLHSAPPGTLEAISAYLSARRRWRNTGRGFRALSLSDPATESPMETRLRLVAVLGGLPHPQVNVPLIAAGRFLAKPDMLLAEARLGFEYDGADHRKGERRSRDRRRERLAIRVLDILLVSFDIADLCRPIALRDEMVELYEHRSGLLLPRPLPVPPRVLPW